MLIGKELFAQGKQAGIKLSVQFFLAYSVVAFATFDYVVQILQND